MVEVMCWHHSHHRQAHSRVGVGALSGIRWLLAQPPADLLMPYSFVSQTCCGYCSPPPLPLRVSVPLLLHKHNSDNTPTEW
jgi:hypothetical protein